MKLVAILTLISLVSSQQTCPKYYCEKNDNNTCALGHYNTTNNYTHVSLNDICEKNQFCDTPEHRPFIEFTKATEKDVMGSCTNKTRTDDIKAYPGESCAVDSDCYVDPNFAKIGKCENKVCTGAKVDEECSSDVHCIVGNYCDNGKCQAQKKADQNCTISTECLNTLACVDSKCSKKYFTFTAGNKTNDPFLCETGYLTNGECGFVNSTDTKIAKEANLVRCELGQKCNYTDINGVAFTRDCECGYNSEGIGYCPRDDVEKMKDYSNYHNSLIKAADNKCHTLNRFTCRASSNYNDLLTDSRRVQEFHLYYNSVKCAEKVLGSGITQLSFVVLAVLALLF